MIVIRPITSRDLETLMEFSLGANLGMRNLPPNEAELKLKIENSLRSFTDSIQSPNKEGYLFVLEDLSNGKIGGVSGILASSNPDDTYSFQIRTEKIKTTHAAAVGEIKTLHPISSSKVASELCSLYLHPDFRHSGQGRLLSLSRLLFIASHPHRFRSHMIAELRGVINTDRTSPFWECVGRHFCDISFADLMDQLNRRTIPLREILPVYPIYIPLLPKEVQEIIGQCHETSVPALKMLLSEGFQHTGEVDALEAGPTLIAPTANIRSVKKSRITTIEIVEAPFSDGDEFILANTNLRFRACYGNIRLLEKRDVAIIPMNIAEALQVKNGDEIRYVTLH
jgi:arginine N-succinyltransferase